MKLPDGMKNVVISALAIILAACALFWLHDNPDIHAREATSISAKLYSGFDPHNFIC